MNNDFYSKQNQSPFSTDKSDADRELSRQLQEAKSLLDDIQQTSEQAAGRKDKSSKDEKTYEAVWLHNPTQAPPNIRQTEDKTAATVDLQWIEASERLCKMKAEEFIQLGYSQVTADEIWECVRSQYKKSGPPALHQMVNDILTLKVSDFMNWMTLQAYKGTSFLEAQE